MPQKVKSKSSSKQRASSSKQPAANISNQQQPVATSSNQHIVSFRLVSSRLAWSRFVSSRLVSCCLVSSPIWDQNRYAQSDLVHIFLSYTQDGSSSLASICMSVFTFVANVGNRLMTHQNMVYSSLHRLVAYSA